MLAHVVHRADVGVRELRDGAGFTVEALAELRVRGQRVDQHLDRDGSPEPGVTRPIHLTHATDAQRRDDLVGADTGSGS